MEHLSQKWCVVSLLESGKEGYEFDMSEWPLHITLAGVHEFDWLAETAIADFAKIIEQKSAYSINATGKGALGTVEVIFVNRSKELMDLHESVIGFLNERNAVFNNPEWQGEGYIPHATIQKHAAISVGTSYAIDNVALVDMFPHEDGHRRKIQKIFYLH